MAKRLRVRCRKRSLGVRPRCADPTAPDGLKRLRSASRDVVGMRACAWYVVADQFY